MVAGVVGSMARALISLFGKPEPCSIQLAPPSVLLDTVYSPAKMVFGETGSMAIVWI
jgi:hypothetical protein